MSGNRWLLLPLLLLTLSPVLAYISPGTPTGFVSDFADILTPEEEATLNQKLTTLASGDGAEVAIVIVPTLGEDTIENYAVSLFADWAVGKEGLDNGLLLLVALEEREVRIEVGYGLEGTITDAQAFWIIRDVITPAFQAGDYYVGISGAVDRVIEAITGGVILPSAESVSLTASDAVSSLTSLVSVAFIALAAFLGRTKSFWFGGVVGLLVGVGAGIFFGSWVASLVGGIVLGVLGLIFDFIVSRGGGPGSGMSGGLWSGGGGKGGGFGGFGGGSSGGAGASGRW